MIDTTFIATLVVVLLGALLGAYLRGRQKDRCLNDFNGDHVTLELVDGRLVWGTLHLESSGMELEYSWDVQDDEHIETSYLLYKDEFPQIQAVYRYCDEMDELQMARRREELEHAFHPGFWPRLRRRIRNFLSMASDSLSEAIGVVIGGAKKPAPQFITEENQAYLTNLGSNIIGYVGTSYDPLLERYVGTKVVVEVVENGVVHEHVGVLRDYTAEFLEILDVHYPMPRRLQLDGSGEPLADKNVRAERVEDGLALENVGRYPLLIESVHVAGQERPVNAVLDRGDNLTVPLGEAVANDIDLNLKIVRYLDWIVPRSHALIRHKAERYDPDQVFDIGFVLKIDRDVKRERLLKEVLEDDPSDACTAMALGQLLYRRGKAAQAQYWYKYALKHRARLPDGGKLAERQLRYIGLKQSEFNWLVTGSAGRKRKP